MKEFDSFLLTLSQEANHMNVHNRDFLQIQGDFRTAPFDLVGDLLKMLRLRMSDEMDCGGSPIRRVFDPQHVCPPWRQHDVGHRQVAHLSSPGRVNNAERMAIADFSAGT
jgi:hypothetical protein